jgi:hypothetical protein
MSEPENFLSRWSRRKREAAKPATEQPAVPEAPPTPKEAAGQSPAKTPDTVTASKGEEVFDLSSLPPIESIGADTDIRPFLRAGVPAELTRAALRKAWLADPAIRNYIGPSENSWDFTKSGTSGGVPGFDLGDPGVDVRRLAEEMFGGGAKPAANESSEMSAERKNIASSPAGRGSRSDQRQTDHELVKPETNEAAAREGEMKEQELAALQQEKGAGSQDETVEQASSLESGRRRHGGALPS